jgi:hypothetical protein
MRQRVKRCVELRFDGRVERAGTTSGERFDTIARMPRRLGVCAAMWGMVLLIGCASDTKKTDPPPAPASIQYLTRLNASAQRTRGQMTTIIESADAAAKRIVAGGHLYIDGSQPEFVPEFMERAGGMVGLATIPKDLNRGDVILYAARSGLTQNDQSKITTWRSKGVYIIAFASKSMSTSPYFKPDVMIDAGEDEGLPLADFKICPIGTVANIMGGWTWTGEFVSACTRLGKMPVMYQSYGLPGGRERGARYHGQMFHSDMTVPPIASGVLGNAYLDQIERSIAAVRDENVETFPIAGAWIAETGSTDACALQVVGHMFPGHYLDERTPQLFESTVGEGKLPPSSARMVVAIEYQQPQQLLIDGANLRRHKLIYSSVQRARDDSTPSVIYINPRFPMDDACVKAPGYDISILPASGVMQAAVYWSIIGEAVGLPPPPKK